MTTQELIQYYAKLLILQYVGLPKAFATIEATVKPIIMPQQSQQEISFSPAPTSGAFTLVYDSVSTASINWNDSAGTIQTKLRAISGLGSVLVSGAISSGLTVDFVGVVDVADLLTVGVNTLMASAAVVIVTIDETDQTLPLAVQNGFDITTATGVQLDIIGKYQGVTRTGNSFTGQPITLSDSDFRILIQFAIIRNNAGSSLSEIEALFNQIFPGEILVSDFKNMHMSYLINSSIGSQDLVQLLITEGLLPKPMGVQLATTIYTPNLKFFGMVSADTVKTYATQNSLTINQAALDVATANNISPFNSVATPITAQWLSAAQGA